MTLAKRMVSQDLEKHIFATTERLKALSITTEGASPPQLEADQPADRSVQQLHWNSFPAEIQTLILVRLPLLDLLIAGQISRSIKDTTSRPSFHRERGLLRPTECSLSPIVFYVEGTLWNLRGFNSREGAWMKLPPFSHPLIEALDPHLFKDCLVAGDVGFFCMNVGKVLGPEKICVYNPLTREAHKLPPLNFRRHPVLLNLHVTLAKRNGLLVSSFRVIAVGSAGAKTETVSRKTEIYDSERGCGWETAGDSPGPDYFINEYQTGYYDKDLNLLLCVGFMVDGKKGILAFNVGTREWVRNWYCPLLEMRQGVDPDLSIDYSIVQLVQCDGMVFLFSEQVIGVDTFHCIDRLDLRSGPRHEWRRILTRSRHGQRALLVYPEFTCVPLDGRKLCIFNTVERTGVIYEMPEDSVDGPIHSDHFDVLPAPAEISNKARFYSLNPISYSFQPSFAVSIPEFYVPGDL